MGDGRCGHAVLKMAESYRQHMREYAEMRALEVWYSHMDAEVFIEEAKTAAARKRWQKVEEEARLQTAEHIFPKIANVINGRRRRSLRCSSRTRARAATPITASVW
jgi:hypothetical protein